MKTKPLFVLCLAVLTLASCDLLNCTPADVRCLQIDIYDAKEQPLTLPDTLTITTCGTDSILLNKSVDTKNILLPLSYHAAVDTFVLHNYGKDYSYKDTLFVEKTNNIFYESPDCPTVMMHEILSARCTKQYLDSVGIADAKVNFTETTHLRLFVRE